MTSQEAIQAALNSITLAVERSDQDYPNDDMMLASLLPIGEITRRGFRVEIIDDGDADTLPCLVVESDQGRIEIERCPFAPLTLLRDSETWDGAEIADILQDAGITALHVNDFDDAPEWHGMPSMDWLFPERLSEALSRFDALREASNSFDRNHGEI